MTTSAYTAPPPGLITNFLCEFCFSGCVSLKPGDSSVHRAMSSFGAEKLTRKLRVNMFPSVVTTRSLADLGNDANRPHSNVALIPDLLSVSVSSGFWSKSEHEGQQRDRSTTITPSFRRRDEKTFIT